MKRFTYLPNDNQSYKVLCDKGNLLYKENQELKQLTRLLKKEKYYWIPLIASCSLISFALGSQTQSSNRSSSVRSRDHEYLPR